MKKRAYLKEGLTDTEFRGLVPRDGGGIQTVEGGGGQMHYGALTQSKTRTTLYAAKRFITKTSEK